MYVILHKYTNAKNEKDMQAVILMSTTVDPTVRKEVLYILK